MNSFAPLCLGILYVLAVFAASGLAMLVAWLFGRFVCPFLDQKGK